MKFAVKSVTIIQMSLQAREGTTQRVWNIINGPTIGHLFRFISSQEEGSNKKIREKHREGNLIVYRVALATVEIKSRIIPINIIWIIE